MKIVKNVEREKNTIYAGAGWIVTLPNRKQYFSGTTPPIWAIPVQEKKRRKHGVQWNERTLRTFSFANIFEGKYQNIFEGKSYYISFHNIQLWLLFCINQVSRGQAALLSLLQFQCLIGWRDRSFSYRVIYECLLMEKKNFFNDRTSQWKDKYVQEIISKQA